MSPELMLGLEAQMEALQGSLAGIDPLRVDALKRLQTAGMPSPKSEDFRYSDLSALQQQVPALAMPSPVTEWSPALETPLAARLVFVNGHFSEELSDFGELSQAASVKRLSNHLASNPDRMHELSRGEDSLSLIGTALLWDGIVVNIPSGVVIDDPILISHIMQGRGGAHPHHIIELGEGAELTVLETHEGDDQAYWSNTTLQARVSEQAVLRHIRLQSDGAAALNTARAAVKLGAHAHYHSASLITGAQASRYEQHVSVLGEAATATLDAAVLAGRKQSHDFLTRMNHTVPGASSDQVIRAVADSQGTASFQGKVVVDRDAQHTEAEQSFKALVFDKTATANAKPELEIFADDVKCAHGATVGQLDADALFYLTSRGIDPAEARRMLVDAFTADTLARISDSDIAALLKNRVDQWMSSRSESAA